MKYIFLYINHLNCATDMSNMNFLIFFIYVLLLTCYKLDCVRACNVADQKYVNHTAKIVNVESSTTKIKHSVGGSVKILSGCTFSVRNMTIIPTGNGVYWYGTTGNNTDGYPRIVASALGSYNGQSIIFSLDPQYSFDDVEIMEIRSEGDGVSYGAFPVNGRVDDFYTANYGANINEDDPTRPFDSCSRSKKKPFGFEEFARILFLGIFLM